MEYKKVNILSAKKEIYQFQVACELYFNLKQKKSFKDQIDKCLSTQFDGKTSPHMSKTHQHDSSHAIALIMIYKNRR